MAKFIEVTQKASKISDKYFSVLVNIDRIQCAVTALGEDDRLTSLFFNSAEDDGLPLIKETPSEIHALIKEAQGEKQSQEMIEKTNQLNELIAKLSEEDDDEEIEVDLSELSDEEKLEMLNQ